MAGGRGGKFKVKRGGPHKFTPSRVLRAQQAEMGEPEGMWAEPREKEEQDSDSEESNASQEEESEDDGLGGAPRLASNKSAAAEGAQVENPNRVQKAHLKASELGADSDAPRELSRREREQMEKERAKAAYWKAHLEGKTDQARADMARLAIVRKQREEAARKRAEEEAGK